jgi:hypothetical protein
MKRIYKWIVFLLVLLVAPNGVFYTAFADQDDHKGTSKHHKKDRNHSDLDESYLKPVNNPTYETTCGECHFIYQPELLPSASWNKILDQLDDHFGEELEINPESKKAISGYLIANSAEKSSAKIAVKIMESIGNQTPQRITKIPYIQKNHHELSQNVIKRESIGSLSNCLVCHTTAESGVYDDDNVKIPK